MARAIHRLTALQVSRLKEPGRYADGGCLFLQVTPSGSRNWTFRYQLEGKAREMGLGPVASVTLAEARERAADARKLLAEERDPLEERRASKTAQKAAATTFGGFADEYVVSQRAGWVNDKHAAQWETTLGDAYCRSIRQLPIAEIGVDEVLSVLSPHWQRVPETARRLRMRLEKVLDAAKARGLRQGENPARWKGHLDHLLPRQGKQIHHFPAMDFRLLPAFMAELKSRNAPAALALRFLILTAMRTGVTRGAKWEEIDFAAKVWTAPAWRMKIKTKDHRVPLSDAAIGVLEQAKGLHPSYIFPRPDGEEPLSDGAMKNLMERMGHPPGSASPHGFRSSFTDWAAEKTSFPREVVEMALAHTIENEVEAAYRRGDLFEKRRKLMDAWGAYATRVPGKIVKLRG